MNIYHCRVDYLSLLPCDVEWNRMQRSLLVTASDFVLANNALEAVNLFYQNHHERFPIEDVVIEFRAVVDEIKLYGLARRQPVKPVGDMALFDYWDWIRSVEAA